MTTTDNPIDNDDRLKGLLSGIKDIKTRKAYNVWRKTFLKIYTKYLDSNGILNGKDANYRLLKQLERLENRIELIRPTLEDETVDTANGRRLLTNLTDEVLATERKVQELMPKTNADEERFGFDKFELAAVLLEDGFHGYDAMIQMRQQLESIIAHLLYENTNEITIIHQYSDSVESFIKVMEDLKLVKIMNHCVDVVYQGKERPVPKPPPPPPSDDEGQELPEDSSICSDPDGDDLAEYKLPAKPTRRKTKNPTNDDSDEPKETITTTTKKKKKKKKPTTEKLLKSPIATKKKKKPKKKGDPDIYATDDTEEAFEADQVGSSKPKKQSKKSKMQQRRQQSPRSNPTEDDESSSSSSSSSDDEQSDKDDEDEDENGVAEFLIYFDPKTNTMGRINRQIAVAKSTLVVDKSTEQYKNLVDSQDEKQELIFILKKLERQKPEEESWLDAIKREKAAAAKKSKNFPKKKFHKSTAMISRRNSNDGGNSKKKVGVGTSTFGSGVVDKKKADVETTSFKNRRRGSSSTSNGKSLSATKPTNYQEKYKQIADKPASSGWSKPASNRGLLQ